jgi:hypothetical protein
MREKPTLVRLLLTAVHIDYWNETRHAMPSILHMIADASTYLTWGWLSVSVPNLIVILLMILVFILAIVVPFPHDGNDTDDSGSKK